MYGMFISAPFGNYIKSKNATSVTGTWTLKPRPGRVLQILKTLRWTTDGWTNKLGLRNPGIIKAISNHKDNEVLSIASIDRGDWGKLYNLIPKTYSVELNLSCPNVTNTTDGVRQSGIYKWAPLFLNNKRKWLICKVSPLITEREIDYLINLGFPHIHASNTLPIEDGGLSGKLLIPHTLRILEYTKKHYPLTTFIAGGGITTKDDIKMYKNAGADYVSIGSVCFNVFKLNKLLN